MTNTTLVGTLFGRSLYVGINLQDILYGVELVLYCMTMYTLLGHRGTRTKQSVFYAIFSSAMLLLITTWMSMQVFLGEQMWVLNPDYPNGPDAFWTANISNWYMDLATVSIALLQSMADGLMVYRCYIVWNDSRAIIVPLILWTVSFVLGVLFLWGSFAPGGLYFHELAVHLCLAYYSVSVFLTVMLTSMICYRLVQHGIFVKENLGHKFASTYFAIVALVIESMLPYSLTCIAFIVFLGTGSQVVSLVGYINAPMMCVSPQMLILRVAMRLSTNDKSTKPLPSFVNIHSQLKDPESGAVSEGLRCS